MRLGRLVGQLDWIGLASQAVEGGRWANSRRAGQLGSAIGSPGGPRWSWCRWSLVVYQVAQCQREQCTHDARPSLTLAPVVDSASQRANECLPCCQAGVILGGCRVGGWHKREEERSWGESVWILRRLFERGTTRLLCSRIDDDLGREPGSKPKKNLGRGRSGAARKAHAEHRARRGVCLVLLVCEVTLVCATAPLGLLRYRTTTGES